LVVGILHLTMTVFEESSGAVITDANVTVEVRAPGQEGVATGPMVARKNSIAPTFYDVNTTVDRVGTWVFTVGVSSELAKVSADFPIEVTETNPFVAMATLVVLLAFVSVLGLSVRAIPAQRRKGRSEERALDTSMTRRINCKKSHESEPLCCWRSP
jgi:hypothetical protein